LRRRFSRFRAEDFR